MWAVNGEIKWHVLKLLNRWKEGLFFSDGIAKEKTLLRPTLILIS